MPVLFDRRGKRPGQLQGRSPWMQSVHVDVGTVASDRLFGRIAEVEVTAATQNSLTGAVATVAPATCRGRGLIAAHGSPTGSNSSSTTTG